MAIYFVNSCLWMKEDLLHFIWKYKKLPLEDLFTSDGQSVTVLDTGTNNHLAGPDFFNAKIQIDEQLWAGNVEIHINSSDWYTHNHEKDPNYNNVVLHVVWHDDCKVYRSDNTEIPALEIKDYVSNNLLKAYEELFDKRKSTFINCEKDISQMDGFLFTSWLERLYFERLEAKSVLVEELLGNCKNDWENVLFVMLLKNFGLKINAPSFLSLAQNIDYSIMRKTRDSIFQLESLLFGMSGLLKEDNLEEYPKNLRKEFDFLKTKFELNPEGVEKPDFFKLRPPNFPTIRLSQFANLFGRHQNLFSKIIETNSLEAIYGIFDVSASSYWDDHFNFGKKSKSSKKKLTKKFIDLLIINTILPIKFCYAHHQGNDNGNILKIISSIKKENNSIIKNFENLKLDINNAMESQATLQLYNEYCTKNKCLKCVVGSNLLQGNI